MICVPLVGPSMEKALSDIPAAEEVADILELRLDLIENPNVESLLKAARKPCIVTNRSKVDGGQFPGSEEERLRLLRRAVDAGADYVDIEVSTPKEHLKPFLEAKGESRVILSYHNFTDTPEDLNPFYDIMCQLPGDVLKIATYARDITDNIQIFQLLQRARRDERKLIGLCMGDYGEISRILSPLMGGFLTFGCLETGRESAPGQIPAATLKQVYRLGLPRDKFRIYGLIGNPVSKSKGYLIHNRALQEINSPDIYVSFLVNNVDRFFSAFEPYFEGLSVTMPFKEDIIPLLDSVDDTARKIGAVNTVVREGTAWKGYNTDCIGALQALEAHADLKGKNVLIIGAGGTAKAIGHGVVGKGANLTLTYNRNRERGEQLARELNCGLVSIRDAGEQSIDVLINCSPAGMSPNVEETPFPSRHLRPGMIVFDSVYNPAETRLLREAQAAGCVTISGLELFLNQAAAQFELWTGTPAPFDAMRDALTGEAK